ncbi:TPA: hypothetical protein ACGCHN_004313 [Stenotrophomonas maltophilia]|uniref:hypothetical protein n=1 Tax=Stenotrophomonas maltophilia TaxID=40324 RepID=UPI000C147274|nr:hypothetical protein [Stenotrophomonas maltophilia]
MKTHQTTSVSHNGVTYDLRLGGWLKHLHSDLSEALSEIATEELYLPNRQTAGTYKTEKRTEYSTQPDKQHTSAKKHLDSCSKRDFGLEWDKLINKLKQVINETCIPLLIARRKLSLAEQRAILLAASNGHVGAMYWIGTGLRDIKDDNCLLWLSKAHNQGHVGACYEMAAHLASMGNHIESLRCLVVSADGGCDIAFMSIFDFDVLLNMPKAKDISLLENMLDDLATTHSSSARYLKGMLLLLQGKKTDGIAVLEAFSKDPKKQPPKDDIDVVYENQIKVISSFVDGLSKDIALGVQPLNAISARCKQTGSIRFEDYDELAATVMNLP